MPEHTWRQAVIVYSDDIAKATRWPTSGSLGLAGVTTAPVR